MEEQFFEFIGYIIAALFVLLPRILKALAKKKTADPKQVTEPKKTATKEPPRTSSILPPPPVEESDELLTTQAENQALLEQAKTLLAAAQDLSRRCAVYGGAVEQIHPIIESNCVTPCGAMVKNLSGRIASKSLLTWDEAMRVRSNLRRIDRLISLLNSMTAQRVRPDLADFYESLDQFAQDCLTPFVLHARRFNLRYPTRQALVTLGEEGTELTTLLSTAAIAPVILQRQRAKRPYAWVQLASDVALDLFHSTDGLARTIVSELGVLTSWDDLSQYSNNQSLIAAAVGAWLPRIFADTCAALYLGPAFAAGLNGWLDIGVKPTSALIATIGDKNKVNTAPLYIRMYVACAVLEKNGLPEEADRRWRAWNARLSAPAALTIRDTHDQEIKLSLEQLINAVGRVVTYLLERRFSELGGQPIPAILDLRCDEQLQARIDRSVGFLVKGTPVGESGRVLLAAAQLAVAASSITEQRILSAALRSLSVTSLDDENALRSPAVSGPKDLRGVLTSGEQVARAIAIGAAFAPRTARIARRREDTVPSQRAR